MDGLSAAASILAILQVSIEVVGYLKDVKDAPKDCKHCQAEASTLHDLLNNLYFHLNRGPKDEVWFKNVQALTVKNGPLDQYKQALKQLLWKVELQGGVQKIKRRLVWTFTKGEVDSILKRMERVKGLITIALGTDHFKLSQAIKEDTAEVRSALPTLQADTSIIKDTQSNQKTQASLDWLSPSDFPAQQQDIISEKQEGTAQWFLESPEFKRWIDGTERTLFCPGIPGAGKTMIAAVAIFHVHEVRRTNGDICIAYVFCNYKPKFEQSVLNILAALLKQLARTQPQIADIVMKMHNEHERKASRPAVDELTTALQSACLSYPAVHIIIDALDECSTPRGARDQLIAQLRKIQEGTGLRLLFTSRPIPEITQHFQTVPILEIRARAEDVRTFVKGHMQTLPDCVWSNEKLKVEVEEKIAEAVDGMFLLARLYIGSLTDQTTPKQVRGKLACLRNDPDALNRAYEDALKRIDGQLKGHRQLARRAISWITFAQRLLTTEELRHALAIEKGEKALDYDNLSSMKDIISVCAGLITVDEESNIVRLVHYTTEEYFERVRMTWVPEAQVEIANACLTYLCFDTFSTGSSNNNKAFEQRLAENVFYDYSARFWGEHVRPVQNTLDFELARSFFYDGALIDSAIQAVSTNGNRYSRNSQCFSRGANGLHLTAQYGLEALTSLILEEEKVVADLKDEYSWTPLFLAAEGGHEAVVRLLLSIGKVDPDSKDKCSQTPLFLATGGGYEEVVRLLLATEKVDPDSKDIFSRTPLFLAAEGGHEAVVRLLLATGKVDPDSKDQDTGTPLFLAAVGGYEVVVRLLLATGKVDPNWKDKYSWTPLILAAERGHEAVVRLLLATGKVHPDSKDMFSRTPLFLAAEGGHEAVVRLLIATGKVEADPKDKDGLTPLWWAAYNRHEAVVRLLLETGKVEAGLKDKDGLTPLWWAMKRGHKAVVRLLQDAIASRRSHSSGTADSSSDDYE